MGEATLPIWPGLLGWRKEPHLGLGSPHSCPDGLVRTSLGSSIYSAAWHIKGHRPLETPSAHPVWVTNLKTVMHFDPITFRLRHFAEAKCLLDLSRHLSIKHPKLLTLTPTSSSCSLPLPRE